MAKNEPMLEVECPKCGAEMRVDKELKLTSNITVLHCCNSDSDDENFCDYSLAKDQSVKLSGNLVKEIAYCMNSLGGYASLGEFVREAVRIRTQTVDQNAAAEGMATFMGSFAEDPELWREIIAELNGAEGVE